MALLLGKGVEDIRNRVMEYVGECVLYWLGRWWQRRNNCCMGRLLFDIVPPPSCHLSPSLNSSTWRIAFN